VRRPDTDAGAHHRRINADKLANCRCLVDRLAREDRLAPPGRRRQGDGVHVAE
jgi:hypothetical protein